MSNPHDNKTETKLDALVILGVLSGKHDPRVWAFFDELRIGTGRGKDNEQRFDAWAIHYFPSKRNVTRCYEIKVSRSDFFSEIRKPLKRRNGLRLSNEFYFVAPKGMLAINEIPPECGLLEVDQDYSLRMVITAPFRDVLPPTWLFVAALARRWDKPRLAEVLANNKEWIDLQHKLGRSVVKSHIQKWENYNLGDRTVPDMILKELKALEIDIVNAIVDENNPLELLGG